MEEEILGTELDGGGYDGGEGDGESGTETNDTTLGDALGFDDDGEPGEGEETPGGEDGEGEDGAEEPPAQTPEASRDAEFEAKAFELKQRENRLMRDQNPGNPIFGADPEVVQEIGSAIAPVMQSLTDGLVGSYRQHIESALLPTLHALLEGERDPNNPGQPWTTSDVVRAVGYLLAGKGGDESGLDPRQRSLLGNLQADVWNALGRTSVEAAEHFDRRGRTAASGQSASAALEQALTSDFLANAKAIGVTDQGAVAKLANAFNNLLAATGATSPENVQTPEQVREIMAEFFAGQKEILTTWANGQQQNKNQRLSLQRNGAASAKGGRGGGRPGLAQRIIKNDASLEEALRGF